MERGGGGGGCSLSLLSGSKKTEANNELWLFPLLTRVLCGFLFGAEDPYFKILMIASADIRVEGRGETAVSVIAIGGRVRRARI